MGAPEQERLRHPGTNIPSEALRVPTDTQTGRARSSTAADESRPQPETSLLVRGHRSSPALGHLLNVTTDCPQN